MGPRTLRAATPTHAELQGPTPNVWRKIGTETVDLGALQLRIGLVSKEPEVALFELKGSYIRTTSIMHHGFQRTLHNMCKKPLLPESSKGGYTTIGA